MIKLRCKELIFLLAIIGVGFLAVLQVYAAGIEKYIPDTEAVDTGLSLWQIIKAGGEVMVVLSFLSIAGLSLVIYYFITMVIMVTF